MRLRIGTVPLQISRDSRMCFHNWLRSWRAVGAGTAMGGVVRMFVLRKWGFGSVALSFGRPPELRLVGRAATGRSKCKLVGRRAVFNYANSRSAASIASSPHKSARESDGLAETML